MENKKPDLEPDQPVIPKGKTLADIPLPVLVDPTKLYTNRQYSKLIERSDGRVSQMVKGKQVKSIKINGGTLIYLG